MKQQESSSNVLLLETPDEIEIEVCDILLNLPTLIHQSEINNNNNDNLKSPFSWAKKRKRSIRGSSITAAAAVAAPSPHHHRLLTTTITPPPPPPPSTTTSFQNDEVRRNLQDKVEAASSPATPLSFSPSESDDKSMKKNSKKRSREEWLEIIEGLTQSREILRGEVENVKSYYNKLKAYNMELKAMKHERLTAYVRQQLPQHYMFSIMPHHHHHQQQQSYVVDQEFQYPYNGNGFGTVNHVGPRGIIPDLNVSPEEAFGVDSSQPLDYGHGNGQGQTLGERKAIAAEKRMIRRMINMKKRNEQRSR